MNLKSTFLLINVTEEVPFKSLTYMTHFTLNLLLGCVWFGSFGEEEGEGI
jgi:hypothetical protein